MASQLTATSTQTEAQVNTRLNSTPASSVGVNRTFRSKTSFKMNNHKKKQNPIPKNTNKTKQKTPTKTRNTLSHRFMSRPKLCFWEIYLAA